KVPPPENLPVMSRDLNNTIQVILIQRIFELQQGALQRIQREQIDLLLQERRKLEQQIAKERVEKLQVRIELRRELQKSVPEFLKASLKDKEQNTRLVAVEIIGERRMHVEEELIGLLTDRDPEVRQAARLALQKIGRGTDFGPTPAAERGERLLAGRTWRRWLAIQKEPELARAGPPRQKDEKQTLRDIYLEGLDSESAMLAKQLVQTPGDKLADVLTELEGSKDAAFTV